MEIMRKLLPIITLSFFVLLSIVLTVFKPQAEQRLEKPAPLMSVEVVKLARLDYPIEIASFGTVQPRTQSILLPQVAGQIIEVSPQFRDGGFFEKNDILLVIDPRDYATQVLIAESELADAKLALIEEEARADQARKEWQRLGNNVVEPPDLVLRKPQLAAADAQVRSAEGKLAQAQLSFDRTKIRAPFAGRVLTANVDLGTVVSPSTNLASLYAIDYVEIRLPVKNSDLGFMNLPENYRFHSMSDANLPDVQIENSMAFPAEIWHGKIVRTEGALDSFSHQLYVIAQLDDPYGSGAKGRRPLKIGQYVKAKISGKMLKDVIMIPNAAIYQGSYVYIVRDGTLLRRDISIAWQNDKDAIISSGLETEDVLVTTNLGQISSGTRVTIAAEKSLIPHSLDQSGS